MITPNPQINDMNISYQICFPVRQCIDFEFTFVTQYFPYWTWHSSLVFWEKKNTKYLLFCCCAYFLWEWRRRREVNCKAHEQSLLFHWGCHNKLLHSILRVWTKFIEVSITLHSYTYMNLNFGSYGKEKKCLYHAQDLNSVKI